MAYDHHDGSFGVYMAHKINKLQNFQNNHEVIGLTSQIFDGCSIFVNGYTKPPIEELRRLVTVNGGTFNAYHISTTTHFVCNHFTDAQVKLLSNRQTGSKVKMIYVTSDWILSSVSKGCRLPEADFVPEELRGQYGSLLTKFFPRSTSNGNTTSNSRDFDMHQSQPINSSNVKDNTKTVKISNHPSRMNSEDDPEFISKYFGQSRLHFIGTWRTRLPMMVADLGVQIAPKKLNSNSTYNRVGVSNEASTSSSSSLDCNNKRVVIHIDMDCFFVSALVRDDPLLSVGDIAVAVAHSSNSGTSTVSSCNYAARAKGIHSEMFMSDALKLCPNLKVLTYNFPLYEMISRDMYRILFSYPGVSVVEAVSVDEAYVEFPWGVNGEEKARDLRSLIYHKTKCRASAGVSYNMLLARIATRKAKPNGQYCIADPLAAKNLLRTLNLEDLPGVGYQLSKKLHENKMIVCGHLWEISLESLKSLYGESSGLMLWNSSRGIDNKALTPVQPRRSISAEVNWGLRFTELDNSITFLAKLSKEVSNRMTDAGYKGKCVTIKIKKRKADAPVNPTKFLGHGRVDNISKSITLNDYVDSPNDLSTPVIRLFKDVLRAHSIPVTDLRGIGIQVSKLVSTVTQPSVNSSVVLSSTKTLFPSREDSTENLSDGESVDNIEGWQNETWLETSENQYVEEVSLPSHYLENYESHEENSNMTTISISDDNRGKNDESFTSSQEEFLINLPDDMRNEVRVMLRQERLTEKKVIMSSESSKNSTAQINNPAKAGILKKKRSLSNTSSEPKIKRQSRSEKNSLLSFYNNRSIDFSSRASDARDIDEVRVCDLANISEEYSFDSQTCGGADQDISSKAILVDLEKAWSENNNMKMRMALIMWLENQSVAISSDNQSLYSRIKVSLEEFMLKCIASKQFDKLKYFYRTFVGETRRMSNEKSSTAIWTTILNDLTVSINVKCQEKFGATIILDR